MDPTLAATAATAAASGLSAAGLALRRSGLLGVVERLRRNHERIEVVREQRLMAVGVAAALPTGSTLDHRAADGSRLTIRTTMSVPASLSNTEAAR